jgi:hypothetical protein
MTRIVTTHYRYKRPARKRKAVPLEASAVVKAKSSRRPNLEAKAAAEVPRAPVSRENGTAAQPSTSIVAAKSRRPSLGGGAAAEVPEPPAITTTGQHVQLSTPRDAKRDASPANDARKPAIVTIKRKSRFGDAPDLTRRSFSGAAMPPTPCGAAWWVGRLPRMRRAQPCRQSLCPPQRSRRSLSLPGSGAATRRICRWSCHCPASPSSATATTTSG